MTKIKKILQILFGLAHLSVIPLFLLATFVDDKLLEEGLQYIPMGIPLMLSLIVIAFTMPHQIFLLLALPIPVILPTIGCFTLGRNKIIYTLFVVVPHIINTLIVCSMIQNDPLVGALHIGYLVVALLLLILPG